MYVVDCGKQQILQLLKEECKKKNEEKYEKRRERGKRQK
jgi:hypothetical protein